MRNVKKLVSAILIGIFALSVSGCSLVEKTPNAIKNTVLAKVGKTNITKGMLDEQMKTVIDQIKAQYGEAYTKDTAAMDIYKQQAKSTLDNMVTEQVLLLKAKELKLEPDVTKMDEEVAKEIDSVKKNYFDNDQTKFDEGIKEAGYTLDTLKDQYKEQITNNKDQVSENRVVDSLFKDVTVTEKEMGDYYTANITSFATKPGANLAHILVATEDEAKSIKVKLDKGETFEEMAKQYTTDPSGKDNGGNLGYVAYDSTELVAEFMAGAKNLKENEVSAPIKSQFGYHLIKATKIQKDTVTMKYEEVKVEIKGTLLQGKKQEAFTTKIEEWKKALKVKVYEDKI